MKFKSLILALGPTILLSPSLWAVKSFTDLPEKERPTKTHVVKFAQTGKIDSKLVFALNQKGILKSEPISCISDIVEIGEKTKEIQITFHPNVHIPSYVIPLGFPLDADELIKHSFGLSEIFGLGKKENWKPNAKGFGYLSGTIGTGENLEHEIGYWESFMQETPDTFINNLMKSLQDVQHEGAIKTCQRNPELVKLIDTINTGSVQDNVKNLTPESAREIANLLASIFGGFIKEPILKNSKAFTLKISGATLEIRDQTKKSKDLRIWSKETRSAFQDFFKVARISLTSDKTALEIVRGK
ncbi:hypothetical protein [Candidatus Bealeia paramacronuclearis]